MPIATSQTPRAMGASPDQFAFTNRAAVQLNPQLIAQGYKVIEDAKPFLGYDISGDQERVDIKLKGGGGYSGSPEAMGKAIELMEGYNEAYPEAVEKVERAKDFASQIPSDMVFDTNKFRETFIKTNLGGIDPYRMNVMNHAQQQFNRQFPQIFNEYFAPIGKKYGDKLSPEEAKEANALRTQVFNYFYNAMKTKREQAIDALEDGMSRFKETKEEYEALREKAIAEQAAQREQEFEKWKIERRNPPFEEIGGYIVEYDPEKGWNIKGEAKGKEKKDKSDYYLLQSVVNLTGLSEDISRHAVFNLAKDIKKNDPDMSEQNAAAQAKKMIYRLREGVASPGMIEDWFGDTAAEKSVEPIREALASGISEETIRQFLVGSKGYDEQTANEILQKAQGVNPIEALTNQLPPAEYEGKIAEDPDTGIRYRSDGTRWVKVR